MDALGPQEWSSRASAGMVASLLPQSELGKPRRTSPSGRWQTLP
jgi:hypothetical protein